MTLTAILLDDENQQKPSRFIIYSSYCSTTSVK